MKPYSQDLRVRVLRAIDQGKMQQEVAEDLGVSLATIGRYLKQRREVGHLSPKEIPGRPPKKAQPLEEGLLPQLQAHPDSTFQQHSDLWEQATGMQVSRWTMGRAIRRLGWTRKKKSLEALEQDEEARTAWRELMGELEPDRLVFLDECGSNIALTPLYARAPRGERARGRVPRNRKKNTTLLASISLQGIGACMMIAGSANASTFETYVQQVLAPELKKGQIVIMDNLRAHKGAFVRQLIEGKGCRLLFLPTYSPDFSPIEEAFSKLKTLLRRAQARTAEALEEAIAQALLAITAQDARGWFEHCGYRSKPTPLSA
jgi:transposase